MKLDEFRKLVENEEARVPAGAARYTVVVGMGTCGIAAGAREVLAALIDELNRRGVGDVIVTQTGCRGKCAAEPLVYVEAPGAERVTYIHMDAAKAREVVATHLAGGAPVAAYMLGAE